MKKEGISTRKRKPKNAAPQSRPNKIMKTDSSSLPIAGFKKPSPSNFF